MNKRMAVAALGLWMAGSAALPSMACEDVRAQRAVSPVLAQAIEQVRQEQRLQVQQAARTGLAQLRSETATALAQGASAPGSAAVKAAR